MDRLLKLLALFPLCLFAFAGALPSLAQSAAAGLPGAAVPRAQLPPGSPAPQIVFPGPVFDFGKVSSGETVRHDFVFTNAGTARLVLSNVQTSCGCTAAGEWTKEVLPGETGRIPLQFNSATFNGPVSKTVTVVSNDPQHPTVHLQIKGIVWKPIEVSPPFAVLNLTPDTTSAFTTLTITNNMEEAVEVWEAKASNPAFQVELRTNTPGKSFSIVVGITNQTRPGTVQGVVTARTSFTNTPVINATTWANVQAAISVVPPAINLPAAPLAARATPIITIINNTTNALVLSDPEVNVPGVDVKVNEVQPGRYYSVVLGFPVGFQAPDGTPVEFSVKSNNPKLAELKIPVHQAPRTANVPPRLIAAPAASLEPPPSIAAPPPAVARPASPPAEVRGLLLPRRTVLPPPMPQRAAQSGSAPVAQ